MDPRKKSKHQQAVEALMVNAGQEIPNEPTMPDEKTRILRARLILEEALEFCEAAGVAVTVPDDEGDFAMSIGVTFDRLVFTSEVEPDLVEMADGLADLSVVTIGSMSAMGIADCSLLEEVDNNNLAKFVELGPCDHCSGTGEVLSREGGRVQCSVCHGRKTLGGYRDEHGKWVKPMNHPKPNIAVVLSEQALTAEWEGHERTGTAHSAEVAHDGYLPHTHDYEATERNDPTAVSEDR